MSQNTEWLTTNFNCAVTQSPLVVAYFTYDQLTEHKTFYDRHHGIIVSPSLDGRSYQPQHAYAMKLRHDAERVIVHSNQEYAISNHPAFDTQVKALHNGQVSKSYCEFLIFDALGADIHYTLDIYNGYTVRDLPSKPRHNCRLGRRNDSVGHRYPSDGAASDHCARGADRCCFCGSFVGIKITGFSWGKKSVSQKPSLVDRRRQACSGTNPLTTMTCPS